MFKRILNKKGLSLLDSLFGTIILSVALTVGLSAIDSASANAVNNDITVLATQYANEQIEIILTDKEYRGYDYVVDANYDNEESDQYEIIRSVNITEVDPDDLTTPEENSGAKKVAVTTTWGDDDNQTVTITTLVVDN